MKTQTLKSRTLRIVVMLALLATFIIPESTFAHGKPPKWAPAHGYRAKTRYVYFPQQNFYYDLQANNYLYLNGRNWSVSVAVPTPFISINLGGAPQVQLEYYGAYPYYYNRDHYTRYRVVKVKQPRQRVIYVNEKYHYDNDHGDKHDKHGNDRGHGDKHGNGHGNGNGKGHGKKH